MLYYAGKSFYGDVYFQNKGTWLKIFLKCGDFTVSESVTHLELQMSRNDNLINLVVEGLAKEMDKIQSGFM